MEKYLKLLAELEITAQPSLADIAKISMFTSMQSDQIHSTKEFHV